MAQTKVVIAVRSGFERHGWWHPVLGAWLLSLPYETTHKVYVELVTGVNGFAASANFAAEVFVNDHSDADWLCIVDNDTAPPADVLRILDEIPEHVDIVSPLCHMMQNQLVFPQQGSYKDDGNGGREFVSLDDLLPGLHEVDRVGGGCYFIRQRVFKGMTKPYFKVLFDSQTFEQVISDDVYFQNEAKRKGFRLFCDTRFVAAHYHTRNLADCVTFF